MRKKRPARQRRPRPVTAPREPMQWRYSVLTALCGAILVAGFFFAARQHFASMDYGIKNSTLRKHIEELESEKRRLLLAREVSLSPTELNKVARKIGYFGVGDETLQAAKIAHVAKEKPPVRNAADTILSSKRDFGGARAIPAMMTENSARQHQSEKIGKQIKKEDQAKQKKARS